MKKILNRAAVALCVLHLLSGISLSMPIVDGSRIMAQDMSENLCALTFDDGPSPNTPALLDMLEEYGIPATFFLLGKNASYYPAIVARMLASGHEIGNHSWSHPNLKQISTDRQTEEIVSTDNTLRDLGASPLYMRPPYGSFDDRTVKIAEDLGLSIILWSLDSKDWKKLPDNYAKLVSTRGTVYEDGELRGIFLFHDTHKSTVDDLHRIVAQLRSGGCERFVTVSEYLARLADPEPPLLMTRRKDLPALAKAPLQIHYMAGTGQLPLARCSKPWEEPHEKIAHLQLESGNAQDLDMP